MSSLSTINDQIKKREKPNDVFITPSPLAKKQIDMIDTKGCWYDPFKGTGRYYNQFPKTGKQHEWAEIENGRDFFEMDVMCDVICSNPPYSMLDKVFKRCIELNPKVISLLLGLNNLTPRRIEWMRDAGYGLKKMHMCKVWSWFGMSVIVQFEKQAEPCMTFDRIVWKDENPNTSYEWIKSKKAKTS